MSLKKQDLDNLMKLQGKIRGVVFQTDAKYVLEKEGEEGLQKLEKRTKELGLPISYRGVKALEWHPIGLRVASLLLIKDIFGWDRKEIRKMGQAAPKTSLIVKLFFKLFLSPRRLAVESSKYWKEHHTLGSLKAEKLDIEHRKIILRLTDYTVHPLFCVYLEGYFETVMALSRKSRKAEVKEIRCPFHDSVPYHDYLIQWE